jgi:phosphatidylglycerol---prolipoprotein diacylglyceryl transferase
MVYEGLFNLVMFFVLWRLRHRITRENALLHIYLASYAFFRFWLEFIRLYPPVAFGLTGIQYLCLGILLWLAIWLWRQRARPGTVLPAGGATA